MVKSCTADTLKKPHFALFFMSFFFVSTIKMLLSHSTTKMQHFTHIIHTYNHLESTPFWKFCSQLKEYIYIYPSYNWITSTKLIIIIDSISSFTILPRFFFFFFRSAIITILNNKVFVLLWNAKPKHVVIFCWWFEIKIIQNHINISFLRRCEYQ